MWWWVLRIPEGKVLKDTRKDYGEARYNMLAKVNGRVFHITFTERGRDHLVDLRTKSKQTGATALWLKAKVRAVLVDGKPYQKKADGSPGAPQGQDRLEASR
jgi:hypothetical protein